VGEEKGSAGETDCVEPCVLFKSCWIQLRKNCQDNCETTFLKIYKNFQFQNSFLDFEKNVIRLQKRLQKPFRF